MKNTIKNTILIFAVLVLTALSTTSFANANTLNGSTLTEFGNYTLTPSENCVVINNVAYKTWDLTYSGNNKKYQVLYSPTADGNCCFLVRGEDFEIQYANQTNGFGVKIVDAGMRSVSKKAVMKQIDYDKFVSQLVLTTKDKSEEEYLGLVACFMPLLFG